MKNAGGLGSLDRRFSGFRFRGQRSMGFQAGSALRPVVIGVECCDWISAAHLGGGVGGASVGRSGCGGLVGGGGGGVFGLAVGGGACLRGGGVSSFAGLSALFGVGLVFS